MPADYDTRLNNEQFEKEHAKDSASTATGANSDYYANAEMSKLTDSEGEYFPADIEEPPTKKPDKLQAFFDELDSCNSSFNLSEDGEQPKKKGLRDLAEGQNLNNSFGCYSPEDWDHLHVDKGMNPQFNALKHVKGERT